MSSSDPTPTTDAKTPQAEESPVSPSDDSPIRPDGVGKEGGDVSSTEDRAQGYIALIVTLHPFTPTTPTHPRHGASCLVS